MQIFMAFHKENVFDPKTLTFEVWGPKQLSGLKSRTLAPIFTKKTLFVLRILSWIQKLCKSYIKVPWSYKGLGPKN